MLSLIFILSVILIALPAYAIEKDLEIRGINALKDIGLCKSVKISPKEESYCILNDKICKDLTGDSMTECKWTVENYAEGRFLKSEKIDKIVIVRDITACHADGYGRTIIISNSRAKIFPRKIGDVVEFLSPLRGMDGRDRLLIKTSSGGMGYIHHDIYICNLTSLNKDIYDICKRAEYIERYVLGKDETEEFTFEMIPITKSQEYSGSINSSEFLFEVDLQKIVREKPVSSKKCILKYQWNGLKLVPSSENRKCINIINKFLPKTN